MGHFSLTYLLLHVSFSFRIDPLRFQAGCRSIWLNLALVFLCLFCVVVHFFDWSMRAFVVLEIYFFHTKPRDWLAETSLKWPVLCRVGYKTTTQSVSMKIPASLIAYLLCSWQSHALTSASSGCQHKSSATRRPRHGPSSILTTGSRCTSWASATSASAIVRVLTSFKCCL